MALYILGKHEHYSDCLYFVVWQVLWALQWAGPGRSSARRNIGLW